MENVTTETPVIDADATPEAEPATPEVVENQRDLTAMRELLSDPQIVLEVRHYFADLQHDYARRVLEIEKFLGFIVSEEDLGSRIARLEAFVGIKRV